MSIFKQKLSKKTKIQVGAVCALVLLLLVLVILDVIFEGPLTHLLTNKDDVVAFVRSLGIFGPLAFIIIQVLQTIFAPIPGNVAGAVGGYLFGWWGVFWTTIGSALGFWAVFWLSRKFGRRLVEKVVKKDALKKFDYLAKDKGGFILFLIFLIPGLPDDVIAYIAGLTTIPIKKLLALAIIGRTPAVIMTNMFGAGLGEDSIYPVVIISVICAVVFAILFFKRNTILDYLKSQHKKSQTPDKHLPKASE